MPIIVTSRDSDMDEIMSMNLGADDFITKPYNTQVLLARIASLLKRTYSLSEQEVLTHGDLKLNLSNGTISCRGKEEELTKNELKILSHLLKTKEMLFQGKILWIICGTQIFLLMITHFQ